MSYYVDPKTPNEVRVYSVPSELITGDGIASITVAASGVTVTDSEEVGDNVQLSVSGGSAASTGTITLTVTTDNAETLEFTVYVPVIATAAQIADTAAEYIGFALRRVVGIGNTATSDETADALERLNALVTMWRAGGAEIGATTPLVSGTVIYCPDYAASALRYNLLVDCAPLYGLEITQQEYMAANRGRQLVLHKNLPQERKVEFY